MTVQFKAKGNTGEIWLYDQVGKDWFGEGITAKSFRTELAALGQVSTINLRINSPGGDVFDGVAIYNALAQHPARIVVDVDGLAASIASVIAMAGDEIRIAANAMMMIHNPQGMAVGDSVEMQRTAALLDHVKGSLVDTYKQRTGNTAAQLGAWMDDETWLTAETAVQHGFADRVAAEQAVTARFARLENYRNVPKSLKSADACDPGTRDIAAVRIRQQADRLRAIV